MTKFLINRSIPWKDIYRMKNYLHKQFQFVHCIVHARLRTRCSIIEENTYLFGYKYNNIDRLLVISVPKENNTSNFGMPMHKTLAKILMSFPNDLTAMQ